MTKRQLIWLEHLDRWSRAEKKHERFQHFRRAMKAYGIIDHVWIVETIQKPRATKLDRAEARAYRKVVKLFGESDDEKVETANAYKAYHRGVITKKQARLLGCNIQ